MPTIDYNQLSALPLTELTFPEPNASAGRSDSDTLFDEYLKRANSVPTATAPATDNSLTKPREADRPAPPKSENASSAKPSEAATPKNESRDEKPSNAASSPTDENRPAEPASDSTKPRDAEKPQNGAKETEHDESKEDKVEPVEKVAIKDKEKKKNKEEKDGNQPIADPAAAQKAAEAIPAMKNMQTAQGETGKKAEKNDSADETESSQEAVETSLQFGEQASAKAKNGKMRTTAATVPGEDDQTSQENGKATVQQAAAENPAEAMLDVADDGKAKTKKIREAVAEAKSVQRKHHLEGNQSADASVQTASDASSPAGNKTGDASNSVSIASQASASVMQSVLEVLKNAEKPTTTEDTVAPIADARANSGAQPAKTAAAREGMATTAPGSADNSGYALRVQFVQRVERAFAAMGSREGSVRLKLSPPELGVLKLEIGVSKGVMKARVEAETPAAKSLLLDNLPELRERLAQQNINIQQFDVDLMDRSTGGMPQQTFDQSDSGSRQQNRSSRRTDAAETAAVGPAASTAASQRSGMGGGLNIIV